MLIVIVLISVEIVASAFHSIGASLKMDRSRPSDMMKFLGIRSGMAYYLNSVPRLCGMLAFVKLLGREAGAKKEEKKKKRRKKKEKKNGNDCEDFATTQA